TGKATLAVSSLAVGSHSVSGAYAATAQYEASSGSLSGGQTVNMANTTATLTNTAPDPTVPGQTFPANYTGAVTSPGTGTPRGTVTILDGASTVCTGTLPATSCTGSLSVVGAHTLTATYGGDGSFNASAPSAGLTHTVNKASTTASITGGTPATTVVGQPV